jgi:intracellular proteinase inhibitor BsuPI
MQYRIVLAGLLIGLGISACEGGDAPQRPVSCVSVREVFGGEFAMDFTFATERNRFPPGEPIEMRISITNCADSARSLQYANTQRYDMVVSSATTAREFWRSSTGQTFGQVRIGETYEPGETKTYTEVWDQKSDSGEQVPIDNYALKARALPCESGLIADCESTTAIVDLFEIAP